MSSPKARDPEDIPKLLVEAWNNRDANALADLFAEDAEFVNVVGHWWHDREAIYKAHDYGLRVIFNQSLLELRRVKIKMLSDNISVVHARMRLTGQTPHGGVNIPAVRQNIFSFVAQKNQDYWICVSAHNTDIVPGTETNLVDQDGRIRSVDYRNKSL